MKINIKHIAKLANLPLRDEEIEKFETQLSAILEYINKLDLAADLDKASKISQVSKLENVTREDIAMPSLSQTDALSQSKDTHNELFQVPAVLEE